MKLKAAGLPVRILTSPPLLGLVILVMALLGFKSYTVVTDLAGHAKGHCSPSSLPEPYCPAPSGEPPTQTPTPPPQQGGGTQTPACSDGVDNDADGTIDFPNDVGCSSSNDPTEFADGGGGGGTQPTPTPTPTPTAAPTTPAPVGTSTPTQAPTPPPTNQPQPEVTQTVTVTTTPSPGPTTSESPTPSPSPSPTPTQGGSATADTNVSIRFDRDDRELFGQVNVPEDGIDQRGGNQTARGFGRLQEEPTQPPIEPEEAEEIESSCEANRVVVLFERDRGPDDRVGKDRSSKRGKWRIPIGGRSGEFYAVALPKDIVTSDGTEVTCLRDRTRLKGARPPRQ